MDRYLIAYDLNRAKDYLALYVILGALKAVRLQDSLWGVTHAGDAVALRDRLAGCFDNDDDLAVWQVQPGSEWATKGSTVFAAWLSHNVTPAQPA